MSTYKYTDEVGDTLEVYTSASRPDAAIVTARDNEGGDVATAIIPKADAPRVALEILKAAGLTKEDADSTDSVDAHAGVAFRHLEAALKFAEAAAEAARKAEAEATNKARLDQEADTLRRSVDVSPDIEWERLGERARLRYRRIALAARELHKDAGLNVIEEHSEGVCSDASNTLCRECISTADAEDGNK